MPLPPRQVSVPPPPLMVSRPPLPESVSSLPLPKMVSSFFPPVMTSSPKPPVMTSLPLLPAIASGPLPPEMVSATRLVAMDPAGAGRVDCVVLRVHTKSPRQARRRISHRTTSVDAPSGDETRQLGVPGRSGWLLRSGRADCRSRPSNRLRLPRRQLHGCRSDDPHLAAVPVAPRHPRCLGALGHAGISPSRVRPVGARNPRTPALNARSRPTSLVDAGRLATTGRRRSRRPGAAPARR